jgi:hypothetical protein
MKHDIKTAGNRSKKGLISKWRNQFCIIPLIGEPKSVLQTNISAAS